MKIEIHHKHVHELSGAVDGILKDIEDRLAHICKSTNLLLERTWTMADKIDTLTDAINELKSAVATEIAAVAELRDELKNAGVLSADQAAKLDAAISNVQELTGELTDSATPPPPATPA